MVNHTLEVMIAPQVGSTCPEPDAGFSRSKPILPERREVDMGTAVVWDAQGQGRSANLGEHRLWRRGNLHQVLILSFTSGLIWGKFLKSLRLSFLTYKMG